MMNLLKQKADLWGENIPWLSALREKARLIFEKSGLPNKNNEAWKYSFITEENLQNPQIDNTIHHYNCDGHCDENSRLPFACYNIKFCNGQLTHIDQDIPQSVIIKPLFEAIKDGEIKDYLHKFWDWKNFPFAVLNNAFLQEGLFIIITQNTIIDKPLYIHYHQHSGYNRLCNIRNIFVVEKNAQTVIIEHFDGDVDAHYFHNIVNEYYISSNSSLTKYKLQKESSGAHHVALNSVLVKSGGKYQSFCAQGECTLARDESYVCLAQENAETEINGIYSLNKTGVSDITSNIKHLALRTVSAQLIKGVVGGNAKGVFQGQIHIASNAQQTEGYQQHHALLLSDEAEIYCKPELEIFADDVKCSHGATYGDLDKEQLFYMQTRGIPETKARHILISAYLNEVINKIPDLQIGEWIKNAFNL